MTEKVNLKATKRIEFGRKTNKGRKVGLIPAVVYGRGIKTESLWVKKLDFERLIAKSGESTMISLEIDGKNNRNVIIYETQEDPVKGNYTHIDFFQVRMDEEIETDVELIYIGEEEALAVKELGGVLVKNMDAITVKCLPGDLPSEINVNVATLATFDDRITISDLKISDKVKVDIDPETVVALVSPPRSEEELSQLEEKVVEDVTKVEGVVKEEAPVEGEQKEEKPEEAKKE
ncbi:MAG: 50S ribosomal protein L25 [Parcubacteria group bacterium]|jgi:large subunit ribosomal protein L25